MPGPARFGALLRQYRLAAGLTQETLAERAGLSEHGIQKLESGATHPYRDTAERLIRALNLSGGDQAVLRIAAAPKPRGRRQPSGPTGTQAARHPHLPMSATTFIARNGEIESVKERLRDNRLLTLIGPGGSGKTRLALEVARHVEQEFGDGVWLIDLAPLNDAAVVSPTIASTVGIVEEPGRVVLDGLTEYFQNRQVLLILDNCEHLIDACAEVVHTLLRACARVQFLATSREMLGVAGEALWRVSSLSVVDRGVPSTGGGGLEEEVCGSESGRLFIDRARLVVPSFTITAQNARAVAEVCHRLDGMPLSIELAAARLSMLSIDQIAAHLDQAFRLLTGGNRTAVRRQQTIRATIDWSYRLLSEPERNLVRRLAAFAGGWYLEAAEAVGADAAQPEEDVFELLSHLVAKSMVQVDKPPETGPTTVRYRLLETIRQYAEEKLVDAAEANLVRVRHRDWFLSFAEQAMEEMEGPDQKLWWDRLDLEPGWAVRIFGATASIRKAPLLIHIPMVDDDIIAAARRTLGDDEFQIAWAEGQSMTLQQVVTEVEDAPLRLRERAGASARAITSDGLTPGEREVVVMLAAGRSNRDIAEGLVITEGTVEVHVKRILSKLGFRSRSQVAAWIAEQNLNGAT